MKKLFFLALCVALIPLFSCAGKKNRLVADTLVVAIDPRTAPMHPGGAKTFTALIKDARGNGIDAAVDWSLDPATIGTLSAANGKTTTFTAGSGITSGKLYATYSLIKGFADIIISATGGGTLKYALLTDTRAAADLTRDGSGAVVFNYFDTDSAAPWQITAADATPGCPVDVAKCTRLDYTNLVAGWGGFYLTFTAAKDISAYTNFTFYVKGATGGEKFIVGLGDASTDAKVNVPNYLTGGVTASWQKVTIPISDFVGAGLNKTAVTKPLIVAFTDAYTGASITVYIDCIGFE